MLNKESLSRQAKKMQVPVVCTRSSTSGGFYTFTPKPYWIVGGGKNILNEIYIDFGEFDVPYMEIYDVPEGTVVKNEETGTFGTVDSLGNLANGDNTDPLEIAWKLSATLTFTPPRRLSIGKTMKIRLSARRAG